MVILPLCCDIRILLLRHECVEVIDRISIAIRFGIGQLFAVFVHDGQRHVGGRIECDPLTLARLDRQRVGRRIASRGNLN